MKIYLIFCIILEIKNSCNNFDDYYKCTNEYPNEYPEEWDENCFQTPPKNDTLGNYRNSYQDMHYLVGYAQLKYSKDKNICMINFITKVNKKLGVEGINYKILFKFGNKEQENKTFILTSENSYPNGISLSARIIDINNNNEIAKLELENVYFIWDNINIKQDNKYEKGQKGVIVELFGWPYDDISEECEFLSVAGYLGVKISPPNEAILTYDIVENGELNPWWYFSQPVSYRFESRLGNKIQLKKMINKCRSFGIRIYSQIVINHMVGNGNDMYNSHLNRDCSTYGPKTGSAGSPFWTTKGRNENNSYTNQIPVLEFPAVPYFVSDFHCQKEINSYSDTNLLNSGWIGGVLVDLNTEKDYVQQRIADFITEIISIGISGIIINNSKHISPNNFLHIFKKLKENLGGEEFPDDFISILELTIGGEKRILICSNGDYSFSDKFVEELQNEGFSNNDINKIKISNDDYRYYLPICDEVWKIEQKRYVINFENQNIQKPESTNDYSYIFNKNINAHKNEYISHMKDTDIDWSIKFIFSSYSLIDGATGFPDGKSDCSLCNTEECKNSCSKSIPYQKAYEPLSTGYDSGNSTNWTEGVYTRVHRDIEIINSMREWMGFNPLTEEELYGNERKKSLEIPNTEIINTSQFSEEFNNSENMQNDTKNKDCDIQDYLRNICNLKNENNNLDTNEILKNIENQIINGSINDILENILNIEKKDLIIKENNTLVEITSSYNQNNKQYNNISTMDLGVCENILKEKYNITSSESLIILKVELFQQGFYIPIIEYQLFHPITKEKLNLDYCNNTTIDLYIPVQINEENLIKHNSSSEYYNDKCYPSTSTNGTDITLEDRKNEFINNNMSLCEKNCEYNGYDIKNKKAICKCGIKSVFSYIKNIEDIDGDILLSKFKDLKNEINLEVLKCFNTLFTKEGLSYNIGNYIILFIILYYIISINFFIVKGFYYFKKEINKMLSIKINKMTHNNDNINNNSNNLNLDEINIYDAFIPDLEKNSNNKKNPPKKIIKINKIINLKKELVINNSNSNSSNKNIYSKNNKKDFLSDKKEENNYSLFSSIKEKKIFQLNKIIFEDYNDYELNSLSYEKALEYDKRTYFQYYISLLKTKHLLIFTFFNCNDYNSKTIKICLFFFSFALYYTINTLFFTESKIHKIYENEGEYKLIYRLPQILFSTIISSIFTLIVKYLSLSQRNILEIKTEKNIQNLKRKIPTIFNCITIKFTFFFEISLLFLIMFWYYLSCFCAVYKNSQIFLIKDTIICFMLSLLKSLFINLLPGIFRIPSLRNKKNNRIRMYKFSRFLELL